MKNKVDICNIGDEGCKHLAKAKWKKLQSLWLSNKQLNSDNNKIGDEGCKYLAMGQSNMPKDIRISKKK